MNELSTGTIRLLVVNHASQIKSPCDYHHGICTGMVDLARRMHGHEAGEVLGGIVLEYLDKLKTRDRYAVVTHSEGGWLVDAVMSCKYVAVQVAAMLSENQRQFFHCHVDSLAGDVIDPNNLLGRV